MKYGGKGYILVDLKRVFLSWRVPAGILGVWCVMEFASFETKQWQMSVLNSYALVVYSMPFLLTYIFTTFLFGQCFCEDQEFHYIRLMVLRGNLKRYVRSKCAVIVVSAMITMALGTMLYVTVLKFRYPWVNTAEETYGRLVSSGSFGSVLARGYYPAYFFLCGIQYGILAGILALAASLLSLFHTDRLFVLSAPLVIWYFVQYYAGAVFDDERWDITCIFDVQNNLWGNDVVSFFYACLTGAVLCTVLGVVIYCVIKRQIV